MKLLINASVLKRGGGLQVSASFLHELNKLKLSDYNFEEIRVLLSSALYGEIEKNKFNRLFSFHFLNGPYPQFGLKGIKRLREIKKIEKEFEPDCVFTIFGPSYWKPKAPHLVGFALPWLINPGSKAFKELNTTARIKKRIQNAGKTFFLNMEADHFVVETNDVKERLAKIKKIKQKNISVVGNTVSHHFLNIDKKYLLDIGKREKEEFRLITISSNYSHKNLKILKEVVDLLKSEHKNQKIKFYVTIPNDDYKAIFGDDYFENIVNVGPIENKFCPSLYEQVDAMFLPTLLECFTASYPEAMIMKKPILTSDLSFAHSICGNAALYFNPLNAENILKKIIQLKNSVTLQEKLIQAGEKKFETFITARQRAEKYLQIINNLVENEKFY